MMSEENAITIVKCVLEGDKSAFGVLVDRYKDYIYDLVFRMTGNREDASDLVQETFVRAFKELRRFKIEYKFSNWLYTIALNRARNFLKRKKLVSFLSLNFKKDDGREFIDIAAPDDARSSPYGHLREERAKKLFEEMTMALSPSLRAAFLLRYMYDKKIEEIANILEISRSAVKTKLHRSRRELFRKFSKEIEM